MIRPASADDADALASLEHDVFGADAWSPRQVMDELAGPTRHVVVAETEGKVYGYATISVAGDVADLTRIVVAESARRRGTATALLDAVHTAAAGAGAERILLEVAESNAPARDLYRVRGYTEISRRRAYYVNGDDAIVLARAVA